MSETTENKKIGNDVMDLKKEFKDFDLDIRILQGIAALQWKNPSLIQSHAIPLILNGKDVMAKARTGSGKTGAFVIPLLQMILTQKEKSGINKATFVSGLILVPTRELCEQTKECLDELKQFFKGLVTVYSVHGDHSIYDQKAQLRNIPDIIVSTPARMHELILKKSVSLESLKLFILDESDLLLSYGYTQDLTKIVKSIPQTCQSLLFSATLGSEIENLKSLVLHTPVVVKLAEKSSSSQLKEYYLETEDRDRYLVLYTLIRLKVIPGKALIFCNTIASGFMLQIFLKKFCISSVVLNSQLPHNSRIRIIKEFNKGLFDFLIATDESFIEEDEEESVGKIEKLKKEIEMAEEEKEGDEEEDEDEMEEDSKMKEEGSDEDEMEESKVGKEEKKEKKKEKKNISSHGKEAGVTRGIDFRDVETVINFDFPSKTKNYIHRVGRTARGSAKGIALSFFIPTKKKQKFTFDNMQRKKLAEGVPEIEPYKLNMGVIEGFRYRAESVLLTIDKRSIKDARISELKKEIMTSSKLQSYLDEHQDEKNLLLQQTYGFEAVKEGQLSHLKTLPEYLISSSVQSEINGTVDRRAQAKRKQKGNQKKGHTDRFDQFLGKNTEEEGIRGEKKRYVKKRKMTGNPKHKTFRGGKKSKH